MEIGPLYLLGKATSLHKSHLARTQSTILFWSYFAMSTCRWQLRGKLNLAAHEQYKLTQPFPHIICISWYGGKLKLSFWSTLFDKFKWSKYASHLPLNYNLVLVDVKRVATISFSTLMLFPCVYSSASSTEICCCKLPLLKITARKLTFLLLNEWRIFSILGQGWVLINVYLYYLPNHYMTSIIL